MHHIIYLSRAAQPFTDAQLQDILVQARQHNTEHGITGALLYGNGQFFQVFEGEEAEVQALYERIRRDPRHHNVTTFADKSIAQRAFPEWRMAFHALAPQQFQEFMGYAHPLALQFEHSDSSEADKQLLKLLRTFVLPEEGA